MRWVLQHAALPASLRDAHLNPPQPSRGSEQPHICPSRVSPHHTNQPRAGGGILARRRWAALCSRGSAGRISGADVVLLEERGEQLCAEAGTCQSWIFAFLGSELLANGSGLGSGAAGFLMGMDGCGEEERGLTEQIGDASPRMGVCPEVIYV